MALACSGCHAEPRYKVQELFAQVHALTCAQEPSDSNIQRIKFAEVAAAVCDLDACFCLSPNLRRLTLCAYIEELVHNVDTCHHWDAEAQDLEDIVLGAAQVLRGASIVHDAADVDEARCKDLYVFARNGEARGSKFELVLCARGRCLLRRRAAVG